MGLPHPRPTELGTVETTNKKLIDRGTRLNAELAGVSCEEACLRLHEAMEEVEPQQRLSQDVPSSVALVLEGMGVMASSDNTGH